MELKYIIIALVGVVSGIIVVRTESRWVQKREPTFEPDLLRYIIVSTVLSCVFVLLIFRYGLEAKTIGYALLAIILCAVTFTDIDTAKIPNELIVTGVIGWLITVWFVTVPGNDFGIGVSFVSLFGAGFFSVFVDSVLAAAVIGGATLLFAVVYEQLTNRPLLGGGDVKLLFMVALYLGLTASLINLVLACIFGLLFGFIWKSARTRQYSFTELETQEFAKAFPQKTEGVTTFPFGPAIATATLITLTMGPVYMSWIFI